MLIIKGIGTITEFTLTTLLVILNLYCIMLQRYNYIKFNIVIKKIEDKKKSKDEETKKEMQKEYSNDNVKEQVIIKSNTFDTKKSLEELKQYCEYLNIKEDSKYYTNENIKEKCKSL